MFEVSFKGFEFQYISYNLLFYIRKTYQKLGTFFQFGQLFSQPTNSQFLLCLFYMQE